MDHRHLKLAGPVYIRATTPPINAHAADPAIMRWLSSMTMLQDRFSCAEPSAWMDRLCTLTHRAQQLLADTIGPQFRDSEGVLARRLLLVSEINQPP